MAKKSKKYYVIWKGHDTGVFDTWAECQKLIKNYPGATYKSFKTKEEAHDAFHGNYSDHIGSGKSKSKPSVNRSSYAKEIIQDSFSVDAACSGNPGIMEYQGVHTQDGTLIFHQGPFSHGTNNVGEFLAIVHVLALCKQKGIDKVIYSDSRTAMAWVRKKYAKTNIKESKKNPTLINLISRAETWLKENEYENQILKWDTDRWGEIPADFGRK